MTNVIALRPEQEAMADEILPKSIASMTDDEIEKLVTVIRLRRGNMNVLVAEAQSAARRLDTANVGARIEKLAASMEKKLETLDKAIEYIIDNSAKIRALRLQAGDL